MMPNKRRTANRQPAKPRIADRIELAISMGRQFDGIWIGSSRGVPEDLTRVERAMLLVKQHSPLHYARIIRDLERIWVHVLVYGGQGEYHASLNACLLDERYVSEPTTSIEQIALAIVHEATHARLERYGIEYKEALRVRIEAICIRRELSFAARLPDGGQLQQDVAQRLDWCQANPEYFLDTGFGERRRVNEIEALRHVGAPEWLIGALLAVRSMINGAKKLFRFAWR